MKGIKRKNSENKEKKENGEEEKVKVRKRDER